MAGVSITNTAIETAAKTVLDERTRHQTGDNPASLADLYQRMSSLLPGDAGKAERRVKMA